DSRDDIVKLWTHETYRTFCDRLLPQDTPWFDQLIEAKLAQHFNSSIRQVKTENHMPVFVDFMVESDEGKPILSEALSTQKLAAFVEERLVDYNADSATVPMDLVLFGDALSHVCRITRVLRQPNGHILLVGVGGSGRQSLARLSGYLTGLSVFQIEVSRNYGLTEFREDLKELFNRSGLENKPSMFLLSDTQISQESFLEDINSLLSSGEVPGLHTQEELQVIRESLSRDAKAAGIPKTADAVQEFFRDRVRQNLHIVLCLSPVGPAFRRRLRMFPALFGCCTIDWFSEWPKDALKEVAQKFLSDAKIPEEEIPAIADSFVGIHESSKEVAGIMGRALRRETFVTPTAYLELVQTYTQLLGEKKSEIGKQLEKLSGGVGTLLETRSTVEEMRIELSSKKEAVAESQTECESLLLVIVQERRTVDEQAEHVQAETEKLATETAILERRKHTAEEDLKVALPALENARKALEALNKSDIAEVKVMGKPPELVKKVMAAVMIVKREKPDWENAKKVIGGTSFLQDLISLDIDSLPESVLKRVSKYVSDREFTPEAVGRVSYACQSLCAWVRACYKYATVYKTVEPKMKALEKANKMLIAKQAALESAKGELEGVKAKVQQLQDRYEGLVSKKDKLRRESEELAVKLERADKLVSGLAGERERWEKSIEVLQGQIALLSGHCLMASAFLCYAGPFTGRYREMLIQRRWRPMLKKLKIEIAPDFKTHDFLAAPIIQRDWHLKGLPRDNFSVENGCLVTRSRRWSLLIDPQGQGSKWLKALEAEKGLKVVTMKQPDYLRTIENSIQFGIPVLIEDVGETLDPSLEPLLKRPLTKNPRRTIKLGDKELLYNEEFSLYISTKLPNPRYSPEICTSVTIVNFAVVDEGLTDQLLGTVVSKERPDLEEERTRLVVSMAKMRSKAQQLEDELLRLLSSATAASLLADQTLVSALENSKTTASEIAEQLEISIATEKKNNIARSAYFACAQRASLLFFVLVDMGTVDPMYQFSLDSYVHLFTGSIDASPRPAKLEQRITALNDHHTFAVYQYVCRGLFTRHKLLFAFQMCIAILQNEGKVNNEEYQFFLRGGVTVEAADIPRRPAEWLTPAAWANIVNLERLPAFANLVPQFEQRIREWHQYHIAQSPETTRLVGEFESQCDELQRMLFVRCLRTDRIVQAVTNFVSNNLGERFVSPPAFDLRKALYDSTPSVPLIFVLSPGVDPASILQAFSESCGKGDRLLSVALGQGQEPVATKAMERAMTTGEWLLLANAHLSVKWLPELEKLIADIPNKKPHKDFRLWISSDPHPAFPIGILQ
ncbi:dynein heavy chain, partial [Kipferlia bialata]